MKITALTPKNALNKAFLKVKPNRESIEIFKANLLILLDKIKIVESRPKEETEEHLKNEIRDFLRDTYYKNAHSINTKDRKDLVIHLENNTDSKVGVIIEAKRPSNKSEMMSVDNLNKKALHELILYFLRERLQANNLEIKHLIATNINEWFIFDAQVFEKLFVGNKKFVQQFEDFEAKRLSGTKTDFFYDKIAAPFVDTIVSEIEFTHFKIQDFRQNLSNADKEDDSELIALFKIFSPEHLLKLPFANDSNSLDKRFYSELLHIIGLTEIKDGSKKLIQRNKEGERLSGSILEDAIIQIDSLDKLSRLPNIEEFGDKQEDRLFNVGLDLCITWVNRILFLKLLEAQLIAYHGKDKSYSFLNPHKIKNYTELNSLFFQVLAVQYDKRNEDVKKYFEKIPYLNSSLFEPTELEHNALFISNLKDGKTIPFFSQTVLKDEQGKKKTGTISTLQYLFEFLDAYDFGAESTGEIQEENKTLINASVLGLIFEKINGYKDGSFFTPGFITMYMCRETIRKAVIQKFNEAKKWNCTTIDDLYDKIEDRKEANEIVNSIKICDPAVGSGHFLVSALNEMIAIKNDLRIFLDRSGKRLKEYQIEVINDELVVTEGGDLFKYKPSDPDSQRVQEALFHEKQTIIENCLFGVDINANSVKICRLRLWIELLKNAYYKNPTELETLPNIDINIKCGNSLVSRFAIDADLSQALKKSKFSIDSYRIAVDTYRNAKNKEEKREMERLINTIKADFRTEIAKNDPKLKKLHKLSGELLLLSNQQTMFEMSKKEKTAWDKKVAQLNTEIEKTQTEIEEIKSNKIFENAFEWRFEFPEVLNEEGDFVGFDVVIGNPPYGVKLDNTTINILRTNYPSGISGILQDSYISFIVLGINLGTSKIFLSYIVPNTWRLINVAQDFRKDCLNKFGLYKIDTFSNPVFEEAVVDCDIIFYNKKINEQILLNINTADKQLKSNKIAVSTLNSQDIINSHLTENQYNLIDKIRKETELLKNIMSIKNGVKPYEVGKGNPKQTQVTLSEKPFTKNYKADDTFVPLIGGSDFHKYTLRWNNDNYISYGIWLAAPRDAEIFQKNEKIIVRQTSDRLIATIIEKGFVMRNNTHILLTNNPEYSLKFILALINSKIFDFIYWTINPEKGEALAEVKAMHLDQLPIKLADTKTQKEIEDLVDQILSTKKAAPSADTSALEAQIDQLVYELYGLTEEEIKIVEGA